MSDQLLTIIIIAALMAMIPIGVFLAIILRTRRNKRGGGTESDIKHKEDA